MQMIMVQMIPLPPHYLRFIKMQIGLIFLVPIYTGCPERGR